MKHWKSGFFLIDRRAIPDSMVWRHPSAAIDDPRPAAGSFSMADVRRLSAHVIKLRDMPEGVLVLSGLSHVWKSRVCDPVLRGADGNVMGIHDFLCLPKWTDVEVQKEPHLDLRPTLQRLPFYCTLSAATDAVIPDPTLEDLLWELLVLRFLLRLKLFKSERLLLLVPPRAMLLSTLGLPWLNRLVVLLAVVCLWATLTVKVMVMMVPVLRFHWLPLFYCCQGGSSATPAAEGPGTRDSRGKGIMADDAAAPDVFGDAVHANFFPFSVGPYYATYLEGGVARECGFTRVERVLLTGPLIGMSVLHCMMMSHGGELLARYRGLLQSHHEYVPSTNFRLKGYEGRVAGLTGLEHQVSALKRHISGLNDKLSSSDASFAKSKAKGNERKKKIKSLPKSLDNLHAEVARLSADLNRATILEAEKDKEILRLKTTPLEFASFFCGQFQDLVWKFLASDEFSRVQGELLSLGSNTGFERGLSMHQTKDEFAAVLKKMAHFMPGAQGRLAKASPLVAQTDYAFLNKISKHATKPLSLLANVVPASSVVASEQNEEWVNAMVDGSDPEMTDGATHAKVMLCLAFPPWRGVTLSVGEKGDGSLISSTTDEEAAANPSGV
ncbi:hypothetical protein Tco_0930651 [Tanacetum coccineum]